MYHAASGRFASRDPVEADINRYRYSYDCPTNATDPSGLDGPGPSPEAYLHWCREERRRHDREFAINLARFKQQLLACCEASNLPCGECEKEVDEILSGLERA
jgi:hypothetical protein